jgi:SUKH-3 immunity protein of toxin-antitoxin system/YwqJ-like deaminase
MPESLPPEVADVLRAAGWSPEHRLTEAQVAAMVESVRGEVGRNGARVESFPAATEALTEFGGLHIVQDGPGRDMRRRAFAIDATQVAATAETLVDLGKRLRTRLFPIGMEGDHESVLAMDETGRVFALDHAGVWCLGDGVAEALTTLVTGTEPPRLDEDGKTPQQSPHGRSRWPRIAPMITRDEAEFIAERWVNDSAPAGVSFTVMVHEFELGYVVSARQQPGSPRLFGTGLGIIDRYTGERSVWPGLPVQSIIDRYRVRRASRPQTVWTWSPADRARWDLRNVATPSNVSHLRLADRWVSARSVKGDEPPHHHRLVVDVMQNELRAADRVRGYERCSEAAAISDALHAEDARRPLVVAPPITLAEARAELFGSAMMRTYRVRETADPVGGTSAPPCRSCAALARHLQIGLNPGTTPDPSG